MFEMKTMKENETYCWNLACQHFHGHKTGVVLSATLNLQPKNDEGIIKITN